MAGKEMETRTRSKAAASKAGSAAPAPSATNSYLFVYNAVSGAFWTGVFLRWAILLPLVGPEYMADGLGSFACWVQTGALLEVVHAAVGLVRSPLATTAIQVASRILLVWGVVYLFPLAGKSPAYTSMILAWSVTEIVRYAYYAFNLRGSVPRTLTWLRYNTFYVLYPIGVASEMLVMIAALPFADRWSVLYGWLLRAILVVYIPGFYVIAGG
ncbi:tyrosine phosphatase-like protein [Dipodascopsis tothii]|uniref:tyrosine phosphatase-like protein n=1 Tax=Dipodascopsis tothii TaxID=44089 RepID=UPI0034CDFA3E